MRTCTNCNKEKELNRDNFHYKSKAKNTFNYICIPCWKVYHKAHYKSNKQIYISKAKLTKQQLVETNILLLLNYLKTHHCVDCGESDPLTLEFDHVRDTKKFNVSTRLAQVSWDKVQDEIEKCEVRCANCHKRKTAKQFGYQRYLQILNASVA